MQKVSKLKKLGKNVISNTNIGVAGISSYYLPFSLNLFSFTHPLVTLCFNGFFRLCFSREAKASHSFMAYMGVRTCSHKTI